MDIALSSPFESLIVLLFFAAMIAGIVDAIAGGGGLITIPSLLLLGIPPVTALGTNRLQALIGELTACMTFVFYKSLPLKGLLLGLVMTAIGALLGTYSISLFSKESLEILLPIMMVIITFYAIFSKSLQRDGDIHPSISHSRFMVICGLSVGFYNGFFGPATGSIWILCFVILLGFSIKNASIATKPLNFMGNLVSFMFFVSLGAVDYTLGLVMGAGQIVGAAIGGRLVVFKGERIVRPIFIVVTLGMTIKLLYEYLLRGY